MMKFGFMINEQSVTLLFSNGDAEVLPIERAGDVISAIKDNADEQKIRELADKAKAVMDYMNGTVIVRDNQVFYKGEVVNNVIVEKILDFANKGYPYKPLCAFLANIMENPSRRAVHELYKFLSAKHLGITDAGTFMAYKAIRNDWTDKHSGRFDNHVGQVLEMPRNRVDDDCNVGCSYGFHVGSLEYVRGFKYGDDRVVIVEVNPKDVVSVPVEDCGKVRVCKYKVVGEYTGPLPGYVPDETACDADDDLDEDEPEEEYGDDDFDDDVDSGFFTEGGDLCDDISIKEYRDNGFVVNNNPARDAYFIGRFGRIPYAEIH